jgi:hypothetical protein
MLVMAVAAIDRQGTRRLHVRLLFFCEAMQMFILWNFLDPSVKCLPSFFCRRGDACDGRHMW